ncbi:hypothetical protein F4819DRAFT_491641 [Hypoxylon fuscum]|nr:hypothetical protein F4819DRAFT_491641 [Hypoxylon fuscum]
MGTLKHTACFAIATLTWQRSGIYAALVESDSPSCTEISFTSPGWAILDAVTTHVNESGPIGSIYFSVNHHATDLMTICSAEGWIEEESAVDVIWYPCATPETQFQFDPDASLVTLQTNWTCTTSPTLEFSAIGNTTIPSGPPCPDSGGKELDCVPRNIEVEAFLTSPVEINPTKPQLPQEPQNATGGCSVQSVTPAWDVADLLYQHFYFSSFSNTEFYYELSFNVINQSNNESVICSGKVDELTTQHSNHSIQWLDCDSDQSSGSGSSSILSSQFAFDSQYNLVGVKQSWDCPGALTSEAFTGTGYLVEPLSCGSPVNQAHYDGNGHLIAGSSQYNCSLPSTTLYGYSGDPPAMPHTSYTRSCTINSFNTTSLLLQGYEIEAFTNTSDGTPQTDSRKNATFTLFNGGSGDTYQISTTNVQDDGIWHECSPTGSQPWQLALCQYLLDRAQGIVAFEIQWYCDDRDPEHAILFTATAAAQLPGEECDTFEGLEMEPLIRCHLPRNASTAILNIDSLTWESSSSPMDKGPSLPWI